MTCSISIAWYRRKPNAEEQVILQANKRSDVTFFVQTQL